jgi:hypothetical protein
MISPLTPTPLPFPLKFDFGGGGGADSKSNLRDWGGGILRRYLSSNISSLSTHQPTWCAQTPGSYWRITMTASVKRRDNTKGSY